MTPETPTREVSATHLNNVMNILGFRQFLSPNADDEYARECVGHVQGIYGLVMVDRDGDVDADLDETLRNQIEEEFMYMSPEKVLENTDYESMDEVYQEAYEQAGFEGRPRRPRSDSQENLK